MAMRLLWGALAGGAISWAVLPWHHATFLAFDDEDEVLRAVEQACPRSGVYGLPAPPRAHAGMDKAEREARDRAAQQQMIAGPIVTAVVQRDGFGSVPMAMARAFVIYAAGGAVMMWLLLHAGAASYGERVLFVAAVGAAAGLICRLPDWNWHGYSTAYTAVCVTDHVIASALVGCALAALV